MKRVLYLLTAVVLLYGCTKKTEEQPGGISGVVTDKATGEPIRAANVVLNTGGSTVTGNDGFYEFTELKADEYTIQVTKTGYTDLSGHKVKVSVGKIAKGDVQLEKLPPSLRVVNDNKQDISELNFGAAAADIARSFSIFNDGPITLNWDITTTAAWINSVSRTTGSLNAGATQAIVITIDRELLDGGENTTSVQVTSDNGSRQLTVKATGEVRILPTLNTLSATNITTTTAMLHGEILTDGTPVYTERGFVYSLSPMPTLETTIARVTASLTENRMYSATVTGLTLGLTYYVRAYAVNSVGTAYSSNEVSLITQMILPEISTQDVTNKNIGSGTVTLNGTIVSVGDPVYSERGFVYGLVRNPTVDEDTKRIVSGTDAGIFSSNLTGLEVDNIYYVRAYATNAAGTVYGLEVTCDFTAVMPELTTQTVTQITETTATLNGNITFVGDPVYSEKGFVYGTSVNPTVEDIDVVKVIVSGSGAGVFSINTTGLVGGTTYYVRAYTSNNSGTVYGQSINFKTSPPPYVPLTSNGIMVQTKDISDTRLVYTSANGLCENSTVGGFDDWRLPTLVELHAMFANANLIGDLSPSLYWSSTPCGGYRYAVSNVGEYCIEPSQYNTYYARCVRTISE